MLKKKGCDILKENKFFNVVYFSKVFSEELSEDYQENLSNQEKYDNLMNLRKFAIENKLSKSLIQNLLQEILELSMKLDSYDETLFKTYLENPLEYNTHLKKEKVIERNLKCANKFN